MSTTSAPGPPTTTASPGQNPGRRNPVAEFERVYQDCFDPVTAFFARRTTDPHEVADLTADTFVAAITSFATFDPRKGTSRAWVLGIARHTYAAHCQARTRQRDQLRRLSGRRELEPDHIAELEARIDAERSGRGLLSALCALAEPDRAAVELVDIAGLRPAEAARALGVSGGALRMRLMRARTRLRREVSTDLEGSSHDEVL